ncbi:unnamed protein product [Microthlaspi erraticum]|uniref:ACT domain-containing protein n=1 Tax=Microthlaspi erraticum TaxID=1685480 RepID=A0A6D2IUF5_9BRAS|nr:unnamed protein product [Microthlaspi erraticum]
MSYIHHEGVRLELRQLDRQGLLAEVTRTFRENGLNVRLEISTSNDMATNIFYVTDADGNEAKPRLIESVSGKIRVESLRVKNFLSCVDHKKRDEEGEQRKAVLVLLGSLV